MTPDGRFDGIDIAIDHTDVVVDGRTVPLRSLDARLESPGLLASLLQEQAAVSPAAPENSAR